MERFITIIVPVYNAEEYIEKCINSILNQSYTNFELIIINDGSTDSTDTILDLFSEKDKRIRIITQENQGVSEARNNGIENSKGEFICFIDADDYIDIDYLEYFTNNYVDDKTLLIQNIKRNTEEIMFFRKNLYDLTIDINELLNEDLLRVGFPFAKFYNAKIIRNSKIKFKKDVTIAEDLLFFLNYLCYVNYLFFLKDAKYNYIFNSNSARTKLHSFESFNIYRLSLESFIKKLNIKKDTNYKIYKYLWDSLESSIHQGFYKNKLLTNQKKNNLKKLSKEIDLKYFMYSKTFNRKITYLLIKMNNLFLLDFYIKKILRVKC